MCGRYAASASQADLVETFEIDVVTPPRAPAPWAAPNWNIAPTDPVAAVLERVDKDSGDVVRRLSAPRWGLVPSWSRTIGSRPLINARLETLDTKPSFRKAFAARRCLLPADGYYEWYPLVEPDGSPVLGPRNRPRKQPFFIHPQAPGSSAGARPLMAMAGLYEFWRNPELPSGDEDAWLLSCAVVTTTATDDLGHIHDRMPVQVVPENWEAWLDPAVVDPASARVLLHEPAPGEMSAYAVSTLVNSVANNGPELVAPIPEEGQ